MKNAIPVVLILIFFCSCSSTQLVFLSVMEPAPVTLPAHIKSIGVVNRSLPANQVKAVDIVDKVFSMEGVNQDKEGAKASIGGLADELVKNNRFTEVKPLDNDLRTLTPGLFPSPLSWDTVEQICRESHTDALFALELFDTDSKISYAANPTTIHTAFGNVPGIEHQASMLTIVKTGWRIYDPAGRNVIDEFPIARNLSFSAKGINPAVAASALIGRTEAVKEVSNTVGHAYGQRIIPYWLRVSRDYYVRGTGNFTIATRKARTGNWDDAAALWQKETTNASGKIAGRACYNMAIINEINGDLDAAIQWTQKAYEDYNNKLALRYLRILENRKANNNVLKEQEQNQDQ